MILPGATLGVLGGGQLGRMFVMRARTMGYRVIVLDPEVDSPAGRLAHEHLHEEFDDEEALEQIAAACAAVTVEFENIPRTALEYIEARVPLRAGARAVALAQDRILEKSFLRDRDFATAPFQPIQRSDDLPAAFAQIGAPALLKTSRLGYDGKGQRLVASAPDAESAFAALGRVPCVLERRLALEGELSVVVARGEDGAVATFAAGENTHRDGILHTTVVPARYAPDLLHQADTVARAIADALDYVGVLGVEFFVGEGGHLFVNELAPRPHNSGHYTLDACITDQFEQQLRALCGLPLGSTRLLTPCAMVNLLGDLWSGGTPRWEQALRRPGVKLHLYGKKEPRPGRKMGHLTVLAETADEAQRIALEAWQELGTR